ncbi:MULTISPECIES: hypothetical protein [unclassified Streptomyces]|uniref:hypothetical protein n=1 Tax=unclassified Streptomyces TaxID=2593676 RepID=UPI0035E2FA86
MERATNVDAVVVHREPGKEELRTMLFSVPEQTWWLIAAAATVMFMITLVALPPEPDEVPEVARAKCEQLRRNGKWAAYVGVPVLYAVVGLTALIRPEPVALILFLYSIAAGSMPIALLPMRRRMYRHYFAQLQNPGGRVTMDRLSAVWLYGVLTLVILASTALAMAAAHESRGL